MPLSNAQVAHHYGITLHFIRKFKQDHEFVWIYKRAS